MMLDVSSKSWDKFVLLIRNAIDNNTQDFRSLSGRSKYFISGFTSTGLIVITRESGEVSKLGKDGFITFLKHFDENGIFLKSKYKGNPPKMAAIVHFHPDLRLSTDKKIIYVAEIEQGAQPMHNGVVLSDDDINTKRLVEIAIRKAQGRFRDSLLIVCNSKCSISNTSVIETLDACHIEPHSKNGINQIGNGLLLRADLHDLFDYKLLFIEPKTHKVHLHKDLSSSEYWIYNGKAISIPHVDDKYLIDRWSEKTW